MSASVGSNGSWGRHVSVRWQGRLSQPTGAVIREHSDADIIAKWRPARGSGPYGNGDRECGSCAWLAFQANAAAMGADDVAHHREPETRAFRAALAGVGAPHELVED